MSRKLVLNVEAIDLVMKATGKNGSQFANWIGIDESYLSLLRNGKRDPSWDVLSRFITIAGIDPDKLLLVVSENGKKED